MKLENRKASLRCVIYTRVSSDSGLEQEFNSLDNQREAAEAYVKSQAHEGWRLIRDRYDDGGFSGGSMERPALRKLIEEVRQGRIDVIVVYKVDRLTRSLADFAKLVELFDAHDVSFVSVTQAFNTTTSMGRLTLNVLLSFAQFEREVTGERIRDKIAASKKKGIWMGGVVPLGYRVESRALHIVEGHAEIVRRIFRHYLACGSVVALKAALDREDIRLPIRVDGAGRQTGGGLFSRGHLYKILSNAVYIGRLAHKGQTFEGQHAAIVDQETWDATQALLNSHALPRRHPSHATGALLAGRLFEEARRLLRRIEFHYVPKHASWLKMVEIEIGVLAGQCLDRRIESYSRLVAEVAAWERRRNASRARINWSFTTEKARVKMGRAYPKLTNLKRPQRVKTSVQRN